MPVAVAHNKGAVRKDMFAIFCFVVYEPLTILIFAIHGGVKTSKPSCWGGIIKNFIAVIGFEAAVLLYSSIDSSSIPNPYRSMGTLDYFG